MSYTSFGTAIPVLGPKVGFPGNISRTGDRVVRSRIVLPTTYSNLPFGAPAVEIASATGGNWQSVADYLRTAANAQLLQQNFAGVAVRNVMTQYSYLGLAQNGGPGTTATTTVATTGSGSAASTTLTVGSGAGIAIGQSVEGNGIQAGTTVTNVVSTTVTLSLPLLIAISGASVLFTSSITPATGYFPAGAEADVLLRGSVTVAITAGTPQANNPVYIRTVANAATLNTAVGDFEATDEVSTSTITLGTTAGSTALTTSAGTGVAVGQRLVSVYHPLNTYIVSGSSTSWVTSQPALITVASGGAGTFYNTALLGSVMDPWLVFSTGQMDSDGLCEITIKTRHAA